MSDFDNSLNSEEINLVTDQVDLSGESAAELTEQSAEPPAAETIEQTVDRLAAEMLRDEKGRFAGKATKPEEPAQPQPVADQQQAQPTEPASAPAPEKIPQNAPAEVRQAWGSLPQQVKDYINTRELDFQRGMSQHGQLASIGRQFQEVLTPYMPVIRQYGANPQELVQQALQTIYELHVSTPEQKAQKLVQIANVHGINLQQLAQTYAPEQDVYVDPHTAQLQQQVRQMQDYINSIQQQSQHAQFQQEQIAQQEAQSIYDKYASNPAFPHFAALGPEMAMLLNSGKAANVEDAYKQAQYLVPEIRQQVIESELKQRQAAAAAEAKKAATAAGLAGGNPSGTAPTAKMGKKMTVDESIEMALRQLSSN